MLKIIFLFIFVFLAIVVFSFLSEIIYKRRSLSSVIKDYKKILIKSFFGTFVLIVATFIYMYFGLNFEK